MRHLLILILLLSTLSFIGCKDESEATYLIDRAESLLKSDPDSSLILLDSIAVPDNLSDKLLARWCMLSVKWRTRYIRICPTYSNCGVRKPITSRTERGRSKRGSVCTWGVRMWRIRITSWL